MSKCELVSMCPIQFSSQEHIGPPARFALTGVYRVQLFQLRPVDPLKMKPTEGRFAPMKPTNRTPFGDQTIGITGSTGGSLCGCGKLVGFGLP